MYTDTSQHNQNKQQPSIYLANMVKYKKEQVTESDIGVVLLSIQYKTQIKDIDIDYYKVIVIQMCLFILFLIYVYIKLLYFL